MTREIELNESDIADLVLHIAETYGTGMDAITILAGAAGAFMRDAPEDLRDGIKATVCGVMDMTAARDDCDEVTFAGPQ